MESHGHERRQDPQHHGHVLLFWSALTDFGLRWPRVMYCIAKGLRMRMHNFMQLTQQHYMYACGCFFTLV
jgi:hypothetical protein